MTNGRVRFCVLVYSQLDESEGDGREMRVDRCGVLCGGGDRLRVLLSVRPTQRDDDFFFFGGFEYTQHQDPFEPHTERP